REPSWARGRSKAGAAAPPPSTRQSVELGQQLLGRLLAISIGSRVADDLELGAQRLASGREARAAEHGARGGAPQCLEQDENGAAPLVLALGLNPGVPAMQIGAERVDQERSVIFV